MQKYQFARGTSSNLNRKWKILLHCILQSSGTLHAISLESTLVNSPILPLRASK